MSVTYRPGLVADSKDVFVLHRQSLADLRQRLGSQHVAVDDHQAEVAKKWERRRPAWEHLANTAEQFWLAEREGELIGYARSLRREDTLQLSDFFVQPGQQSVGVGRELLARAFPDDLRAGLRQVIIATTDLRAVVRYLKLGVTPQSVIYYFEREAQAMPVETDLTVERLEASPHVVNTFGQIDAVVLGYRRDVDHKWLLTDRTAYLYSRGGQPVGYGYVGWTSGPFAMLDATDMPAALAHAESLVAERGGSFGVEVPLINRVAVDYLLARGFQMDPFIVYFMTNEPFGRYENYVFTSPPLFS